MISEREFYEQVILGKQAKDSGTAKDKKNTGKKTKGKKKTSGSKKIRGANLNSKTSSTSGAKDSGQKDSKVRASSSSVTTSEDAKSLGNVNPSTITTTSGGEIGTQSENPSSILSCYIINKITEETIIFNAYPTELNESFSAGFDSQSIMGRSSPYFTYSGNEARSISYSLTLQEDICPNMRAVVDRLKALVYPKYAGSLVQPPYCYLKFGDMVSCYAIVDGVDFSWGETVLSGSTHFSQVEVSFSYQEMRLSSLPMADGTFSEV